MELGEVPCDAMPGLSGVSVYQTVYLQLTSTRRLKFSKNSATKVRFSTLAMVKTHENDQKEAKVKREIVCQK